MSGADASVSNAPDAPDFPAVQPDRTAAFIAAVREGLAPLADPERAAGQAAYLKTDEPMLGARVPDVRRVARSAAKSAEFASTDELIAARFGIAQKDIKMTLSHGARIFSAYRDSVVDSAPAKVMHDGSA